MLNFMLMTLPLGLGSFIFLLFWVRSEYSVKYYIETVITYMVLIAILGILTFTSPNNTSAMRAANTLVAVLTFYTNQSFLIFIIPMIFVGVIKGLYNLFSYLIFGV